MHFSGRTNQPTWAITFSLRTRLIHKKLGGDCGQPEMEKTALIWFKFSKERLKKRCSHVSWEKKHHIGMGFWNSHGIKELKALSFQKYHFKPLKIYDWIEHSLHHNASNLPPAWSMAKNTLNHHNFVFTNNGNA